jgi:flagellar protein FliO/FliZ
MVVGCAVLETAQPMSAATGSADTRTAETVIYPAGSASATPPAATSGGGTWLFAVGVLFAAAGFFYWKKRGLIPGARRTAGLIVEETRALGNRQFLMVAACDGKRFLLGVAPGSIRLLAPLDGKEAADARVAK